MPVDLTSLEVTRLLLTAPREWRERAVERLDVGSAAFIHRTRSLQVRPLLPLLARTARHLAPTDTAFLVLPLAPMPKRPVIDLSLQGPVGALTMLRRPDIAERECALVRFYAQESGHPVPALVNTVLPSLLGFTEGSWRAVRAGSRSLAGAQERYLDQGLSTTTSAADVQRLRLLGRRAEQVLDPYVELPTSEVSPLEMPLLAVPPMVEQGVVSDVGEAIRALDMFATWLETLATAVEDGPSVAGDLLRVLADYGRQWDLMVLGEFPLDRPFTVTYEHLEPSPVRGWRNVVRPAVVVADANSNHVTLRTTDAGTRLRSVIGLDPRTGRTANMGSTSLRTRELHSFYVWEVDVDYRVVLETRIGVLGRTALGIGALAGLVLLVAVALVARAPATLTELAVTAGPTAAVAGSLLLREPSTLASRLRLLYTGAALIALLVLASVSVWRFLTLP